MSETLYGNLDYTELFYCMKTITYAAQTANSCGFSKLRLLFALLPTGLSDELLKVPIFVGRVFFILILNLDL